jgi:hypothetical protein
VFFPPYEGVVLLTNYNCCPTTIDLHEFTVQVLHGAERHARKNPDDDHREKPGYKSMCQKGCGFVGWVEETAEHEKICSFLGIGMTSMAANSAPESARLPFESQKVEEMIQTCVQGQAATSLWDISRPVSSMASGTVAPPASPAAHMHTRLRRKDV